MHAEWPPFLGYEAYKNNQNKFKEQKKLDMVDIEPEKLLLYIYVLFLTPDRV